MDKKTKIVLAIVAVVILGIAAVRLWPDGRISVDFQNEPLGKVLPALERLTRLDLDTNLPPETPVTLQMQDAPVWEVLLTLSTRLEARLQPTVLTAPDEKQIDAALEGFRSGGRFEGWEVFRVRGGEIAGSEEIDASLIAIKLEPTENLHLQLAQISQKSGLTSAAPEAWNPASAAISQSTAAASAIAAARKAGGKARHLYLVAGRPQNRRAEGEPPREGSRPDGSPPWSSDRGNPGNPEWEAARAEATIAALPEDQRATARAEYDAFRKFREEMRDLPDDQRRAKAEEFFSRPEIQEIMAERMTARDNRSSPEQRQRRMKRYVERKAAMKSSGQ